MRFYGKSFAYNVLFRICFATCIWFVDIHLFVKITPTKCTLKNEIQLESKILDSHKFSIDPTFSSDKLMNLEYFSLSPSYKNVFNQFASFMKNEYDNLKDKKITDLLKLCLDIPQFKLYTYTNS